MAYRLMLKELRESRGLRQEDLAQLLGVKLSTYRTWEQGTTGIKLDRAFAICDVLHCTPDDLCGWYLSHPEDRPKAQPPDLTDAQQRELNELYESCGPAARGSIVINARGMAALEKERAEGVPEHGVGEGAA